MKKRMLSLLLVLALAVGLLTTAAMAEETVAARIGETSYSTLQVALSAAEAGDTVVLLADVEENVTIGAGQSLTLDLNGHVLNGKTVSKKAALTNNGTVVIVDSVGTGVIKREDTAETNNSYYVILNEGTMEIKAGHVYNQAGLYPDAWSGSSLICNGAKKSAVLTISGGTISQENFIAVKNDEYGTLYITGGTISSKTQAVQNWKDATISGGVLNGMVTTWTYLSTQGKTLITGDVQINGDIKLIALTYKSSVPENVPEVVITGGFVNGEIVVGEETKMDGSDFEENAEKGNVTVNGGDFTADVSEYLPDGYVQLPVRNGYRVMTQAEALKQSLLFFGTLGSTETSALDDFTDLDKDAWYAEAVEYCLDEGLMSGTGNGKFSPNGGMTRAMVWTVLGRLSGETFNGTGANWYADAQKWAVRTGVSDGTTPNGQITREELVTMLWRFAGSPKADTAVLKWYGDSATISDWAREAMAWAVNCSLVEGSNWNLTPGAVATRCQVAAIFMRYHKY